MEERMCRVCLTFETNKEFSRIFDNNLALKIFLISGVKIVELNNKPALICKSCEIELYQSFNLRRKIQTSQDYFNSQLREVESNLWRESEYVEEYAGSEEMDIFKIESLTEYAADEECQNLEKDNKFDETVETKTLNKRKGRKVESTTKRLQCRYCFIQLSRRQRLIEHERLHLLNITKSYYKCDKCGKDMAQRFSLIPHFQKYHNFILGKKERWKCAICVDKSLPACKMELHYQKAHNEIYHRSEKEVFSNDSIAIEKSTKKRTIKKKDESKNFFPCILCGNIFINSKRYQKHLIELHGVTEQEVIQNDNSNDILINESLELSQKIIINNYQNDDAKLKNICSTCGKSFSSMTTCKAHEKTHLDLQYICDLCDSSFKVKAYLTSHMQKVHMKIKRFKCNICTAAFVHRELLNYHIKKHLNIRNYSCQFCQKTFVRKACALIHERIHKNERPYSCKYCDRQFIHRSDHRRHELKCVNNIKQL